MAKQLQALAMIHEATARTARLAMGVGLAASAIAVAALVVSFVR
jgi:hypothetical protein